MSVVASPPSTGASSEAAKHLVRSRRSRGLWLAVLVAALGVVALLSVWYGSRDIGFGAVWRVLLDDDGSFDATRIHAYRIPRTVLGVVVGVAMGLAGVLMQSLTRNPLADPGMLGVNLGASTGVVAGVVFLGMSSVLEYVWLALIGAALASALVYLLGMSGRGVAAPERLVLAGSALTAMLYATNTALVMLFPRSFDNYRFWVVGSLVSNGYDVIVTVLPLIALGVVLALALTKPLNAMALGDDLGHALGVNVRWTRIATALAVTVLCGAATAAAGPIWFVGLAVPHIARLLVGPDLRWVVAYSLVIAPILLLTADVLGRVLGSPGEIEVGIVTAFLGAPLFIALCRRRRLAEL